MILDDLPLRLYTSQFSLTESDFTSQSIPVLMLFATWYWWYHQNTLVLKGMKENNLSNSSSSSWMTWHTGRFFTGMDSSGPTSFLSHDEMDYTIIVWSRSICNKWCALSKWMFDNTPARKLHLLLGVKVKVLYENYSKKQCTKNCKCYKTLCKLL